MEAIFFALISYFGWGTGDIFGTIASRKIGAYSTTFWVFIVAIILFSFYIPFALADLTKLNFTLFITIVSLGFLYIAGNVAFNEGVRRSNAPLIGTIAGSFPAVTLIISIFFLNEAITFNQIMAAITIFTGVVLATVDIRELTGGNLIKDKGVLFALFSMFAWGAYFAFIKGPVREVGWFWPLYIAFWLFPFIYLFMSYKKIKLVKLNKNALLVTVASAILIRSGDFGFNLALNKGLTALVAPIGGSYPTLYAILSFFIFKDPITKQQIAGIITTLIGIVLLSVFSV